MSASQLEQLAYNFLDKYHKYMLLKIYIDSNDVELINKYSEAIKDHNIKTFLNNNVNYIDAGFDIYCPEPNKFTSTKVNKLDYKIICSAKIMENGYSYNTGFYMYPRSSISKSNLSDTIQRT